MQALKVNQLYLSKNRSCKSKVGIICSKNRSYYSYKFLPTRQGLVGTAYSYLDKSKIENALNIKVRPWQEMLEEYLLKR